MNNFNDIDRRLIMRYEDAATYVLGKVRTNAANTAVHSLAQAIASVQDARLSRITSSVTQHLTLN